MTIGRVAASIPLTTFDRAIGAGRSTAVAALSPIDRLATPSVRRDNSPARTAASLPVATQTQVGNACGTTAMSMVLNYWGVTGKAADVNQIDDRIRPHSADRKIDSFSAPRDLARYAQAQGLYAGLRNEASPDDLKRLIDQGVPPMILVDVDAPKGTGLHYVAVSGYKTVAGKREWEIADPWGYKHTWSDADMLRLWSNVRYKGVSLPYNRLLLTMAPRQGLVKSPEGTLRSARALSLPAERSPLYADVAGSVANRAIGVAASLYDAGKAVSGSVRTGIASLQGTWQQVVGTSQPGAATR